MRDNLFLGVSFALGSTFLYSLMSTIVKAKTAILPPLPIVVFLQSLISLILILPFVFSGTSHHIKKSLHSRNIKLHLLRSISSLAIIFCLYYAVAYIPLVNAMLLSNSTPLIVPFVGYLFFAEKINHRLWFPVLLGYAGVAITLNPDAHLFQPAALLALLSALALAFTIQMVRQLAKTDSTITIMFYFSLFSTLFSGVAALFFWQPPSLEQLSWISLIGLLYFLSQYIGNASMHHGNAQLISALMYANVVYTAIFTVLFWGTIPTFTTLLGMILVVIGGVACIWIEHVSLSRATGRV